MRKASHLQTIIIKLGSTSLCDETGQIDSQAILGHVSQIAQLVQAGKRIVLVSSGAIAVGKESMGLAQRPRLLAKKQALAAIGQTKLMSLYEQLFGLFHIKVGQILLNHDDFDHRNRLFNLHTTLQAMHNYGIVPIINENDSLAVDEVKVGDNDSLASLLVPTVDADCLLLVSDIDGLYDKNPSLYPDAKKLDYIQEVNDSILAMGTDSISGLGTGGMATKLKAARSCTDFGCVMGIVSKDEPHAIVDFIQGKNVGTWFERRSDRLKARAHWILHRSWSKGELIVDDGCVKALQQHRSLLATGVVAVKGDFHQGAVVDVLDSSQRLIGKGIVNYAAYQIDQIKGLHSGQIGQVLGSCDYDEMIHANNFVLEKGTL